MLVPSTRPEETQRIGMPEGFNIKAFPNLTAKFFSNKSPRIRAIRSLELPPEIAGSSVDDCHITETGLRAQKLRRFAQDCSWAYAHVYFGGEGVANDRAILEQNSITHIVNCVRLEVQNHFDDQIHYLGLVLQDSGAEDILAVLYDVFDFLEEAREKNGRVFVHCSQGVSRSAALVIAYVMWRKKQEFEITKDEMKTRRGVVDPNVNFCTQLMFWEKRILQSESGGFLRVYRMAPQSFRRPTYLVRFPERDGVEGVWQVPKAYINSGARHDQSYVLDPRGTFVIHGRSAVYIWIGSRHLEAYVTSARKFACQLQTYENAPAAIEVQEGSEPAELFDLLRMQVQVTSIKVEEIEEFTADYDRFNQNERLSSSMKDSSRSTGMPPLFRRTLSENYSQ